MTFRRTVLALSVILFLAAPSVQAISDGGDAILGKWITDEDKSVVEIYKDNDKYYGKVIWLKDPLNDDGTEVCDAENPDPELRNNRVVGLVVAKDFEFKGKNKWGEGTIYDPENGKTYSCKMKLEDKELKVRGFIGIAAFGRTTTWVKKEQ